MKKQFFLVYFVIVISLLGIRFVFAKEEPKTILMPTILANKEIIWTQEMQKAKEKQALEATKKKRVVLSTQPIVKPQEQPKELKVAPLPCKSDVRNDLVNHAFKISGGDMKFIGTIASESMFDVGAVGDNGYSIGLCQYHRLYQPDNHKAYQTLETDFHKLEFCHEKYNIWKKRGVLSTRLYGSNVWQQGLKKLNISCE